MKKPIKAASMVLSACMLAPSTNFCVHGENQPEVRIEEKNIKKNPKIVKGKNGKWVPLATIVAGGAAVAATVVGIKKSHDRDIDDLEEALKYFTQKDITKKDALKKIIDKYSYGPDLSLQEIKNIIRRYTVCKKFVDKLYSNQRVRLEKILRDSVPALEKAIKSLSDDEQNRLLLSTIFTVSDFEEALGKGSHLKLIEDCVGSANLKTDSSAKGKGTSKASSPVKTEEPVALAQEPSVVEGEAPAKGEEPVALAQEPSVVEGEAPAKGEEPVALAQEPSVVEDDAPAKGEEPVALAQEPSVVEDDTPAKGEEPVALAQKSSAVEGEAPVKTDEPVGEGVCESSDNIKLVNHARSDAMLPNEAQECHEVAIAANVTSEESFDMAENEGSPSASGSSSGSASVATSETSQPDTSMGSYTSSSHSYSDSFNSSFFDSGPSLSDLQISELAFRGSDTSGSLNSQWKVREDCPFVLCSECIEGQDGLLNGFNKYFYNDHLEVLSKLKNFYTVKFGERNIILVALKSKWFGWLDDNFFGDYFNGLDKKGYALYKLGVSKGLEEVWILGEKSIPCGDGLECVTKDELENKLFDAPASTHQVPMNCKITIYSYWKIREGKELSPSDAVKRLGDALVSMANQKLIVENLPENIKYGINCKEKVTAGLPIATITSGSQSYTLRAKCDLSGVLLFTIKEDEASAKCTGSLIDKLKAEETPGNRKSDWTCAAFAVSVKKFLEDLDIGKVPDSEPEKHVGGKEYKLISLAVRDERLDGEIRKEVTDRRTRIISVAQRFS